MTTLRHIKVRRFRADADADADMRPTAIFVHQILYVEPHDPAPTDNPAPGCCLALATSPVATDFWATESQEEVLALIEEAMLGSPAFKPASPAPPALSLEARLHGFPLLELLRVGLQAGALRRAEVRSADRDELVRALLDRTTADSALLAALLAAMDSYSRTSKAP